ncbi:MAG: Lcl domain-containing protein [Burkholderiales bacterium]
MNPLSGLLLSRRRLAHLFLAFGVLMFALSAEAQVEPPYPVIFVHGLNGSGADFQSMIGSLDPTGAKTGGRLVAWKVPSGPLSCSWSDSWEKDVPWFGKHAWTPASGVGIPASKRYFAIDFSKPSGLTFNAQGNELKQVIDCVKNITNPTNPSHKVILVAHSMGGLAARAYLQGVSMNDSGKTQPYGHDVVKLITVGTPNLGSPWAHICTSGASATNILCNLFGPVAVDELRPESSQLDVLNNVSLGNLPPIYYTSIVVKGVYVTNDEDGDGIVTEKSQNLASLWPSSNIPVPFTPLHETIHLFACNDPLSIAISHTCEPYNDKVQKDIRSEILNTPHPATATITTSTGANGSISPSSQTVMLGNTTSFTVLAKTGYTPLVSGCGGSLNGSIYTTGVLTSDCMVSATFVTSSNASISDARVFAYMEANYPVLFSGAAMAGQYQQYDYRYYPDSQNFLAIDTSGEIFISGPFTGNVITRVGPVESFRGVITAWEATQPTLPSSGGTTSPPNCISPQVLQYGVCVTPQPTCNAPQVLTNGACVTPPIAAPDLQVKTGTLSPASVSAGGTVNASWMISNQGTGTANASTTVVHINQSTTSAVGSNLASISTNSLASGGSQSQIASLTAPTTAGTYYVWVIADNNSTAGQSSSAAANDIVLIGSFTVTNRYTVTPSADAGGTISPNVPQTVAEGAAVSFTVTPNPGFTSQGVRSTCGGPGAWVGTTYTTNAITSNCSVAADFTPIGPTGNNKFTDNGNGTVTDAPTGLTWQQGENALPLPNWYQASGTYDVMNNTTAQNFCGTLSFAGGGWRLPTRAELESLIDSSFNPTINTNYFPKAYMSSYWSSTPDASNFQNAWLVEFSNGYAHSGNRISAAYVRCVRGGTTQTYTVTPSVAGAGGTITPNSLQSVVRGTSATFILTPKTGYVASVGGTCSGTLSGNTYTTTGITANCTVVASFTTMSVSKYTDNGNGTVTDNTTGLTWQNGENSTSGDFNWYQATGTYDATRNPSSRNICGSLSLAGGGWRLPSSTELQSLVDKSFKPTINATYFPNAHADSYWSSTTFANYTPYAWYVYFGGGGVSPDDKANVYYVRCVR